MGVSPNFADAMSPSKQPVVSFFNLEELLNRGVYSYGMPDRETNQLAEEAGRHLAMLVDRIKNLGESKISRAANYQWNDRRQYEKLLEQSPVGYVIWERLPSFTIDDVLYRFDIVQLAEGVALRVVQDELGTIKERKKKYFERYEGLVDGDQQKEMNELMRELISNLRKDLQEDIVAALNKATEPKQEMKKEDTHVQPESGYQHTQATSQERKIPSFYDSIFFMGIISQRCATRLHPQLGLLIFI